MAFGLEKPVHRIVVNTMSSLGGVGLTTGVPLSMTLGPGGVGGAITGDNISVHHMFTVKNLAYQTAPRRPRPGCPAACAQRGSRAGAVANAATDAGSSRSSSACWNAGPARADADIAV